MEQQKVYQEISNYLKSAAGLLDFEQNLQLRKDVISIGGYLTNPSFRIAVFGPFNYGKSTLLNALLGKRTLPIDLIPTTGAAISVKYGEFPYTQIKLLNGQEISEKGTDILKQFAILNDQRQMRNDVASVNVCCPHPFLKMGVEIIDLPGTNDREAQDKLVRDQLLTADLVVQILDARKLMTLGERENLRDWLIDRGIKTVVFVVNFLNLLEPEDQKQIYNRLLFVAESFRSELPGNISNLYRVDALPALRARLKGDGAAVQTTGLPMFESALQSIVVSQQEMLAVRLPRVVEIANQVKSSLQNKIKAIASELESTETKRKAKIEIKQKAQKLIQKGFSASVSDFQSWLYLPKLINRYQTEIVLALQQGKFITWENVEFKQVIVKNQQSIVKWVNQACDFFECPKIADLSISFPEQPQVFLPEQPQQSTNAKQSGDVAPVTLASGLGWLLEVPVGAATYLLNQLNQITELEEQPEISDSYLEQLNQAYNDAASDYLTRFSTQAFSTLLQYEESAEKLINVQLVEAPSQLTTQHHQLQLLQTLLDNLNQELELLEEKFSRHT